MRCAPLASSHSHYLPSLLPFRALGPHIVVAFLLHPCVTVQTTLALVRAPTPSSTPSSTPVTSHFKSHNSLPHSCIPLLRPYPLRWSGTRAQFVSSRPTSCAVAQEPDGKVYSMNEQWPLRPRCSESSPFVCVCLFCTSLHFSPLSVWIHTVLNRKQTQRTMRTSMIVIVTRRYNPIVLVLVLTH